MKIAAFAGAQAEMALFGLHPTALIAILVIAFDSRPRRWWCRAGAASCGIGDFGVYAVGHAAALRFRDLLAGSPERMMAMNAFFEHVGLAGGFVLVAVAPLGAAEKRSTLEWPRTKLS
ncbi:hypothetical protein [Falsirhodobacter xinxiangensis]|uniref:hypothetical protein n=1 Tax=Falsirhodobacter xinxiangensis TaxID=2530049 RepID=UPI0015F2B9CF|nr:hypothetical protein [Rhodobacter xinxiangensis]